MSIDTRRGDSDDGDSGIEWVRKRRDKLEEIAESDLPAAEVAQRILRSLDQQEGQL